MPVGANPGPRADDRPPEGDPQPRRARRSRAGDTMTSSSAQLCRGCVGGPRLTAAHRKHLGRSSRPARIALSGRARRELRIERRDSAVSPCVSLWPPPPARRSNRACRPGPQPLCPESRRPPRPQTCARPRQLSPVFDWPDCPARRRSAACRVPRTPGSGGRRRSTARPRPAPAGASGPVSMLRTGPPHRSGTLATKCGPPRVAPAGQPPAPAPRQAAAEHRTPPDRARGTKRGRPLRTTRGKR